MFILLQILVNQGFQDDVNRWWCNWQYRI